MILASAFNHPPAVGATASRRRPKVEAAKIGSAECSKAINSPLSRPVAGEHFHFYRFPINVNDRSDRSGNSAMLFPSSPSAAGWILNFRLLCFASKWQP
jgi:hypothetical protein